MIPFLLLLAVGVGQDPGAMQDIPCGKDKVHTTDGCRSIMPALAYKIQPPDKPCDPKYEYERMTMPDKPGFAGKVLCAPIMHPLKESEYQEIMERLKKLEARPEIKFGKPAELTDCSKEPNHCITW